MDFVSDKLFDTILYTTTWDWPFPKVVYQGRKFLESLVEGLCFGPSDLCLLFFGDKYKKLGLQRRSGRVAYESKKMMVSVGLSGELNL